MTAHYTQQDGRRLYEEDRARMLADPQLATLYEEEAAKKELWLQLVEARQEAGLTQAEVARRLGVPELQVAQMEERGYDSYTLDALRRYVQVLGAGFRLEVRIRPPRSANEQPRQVAHA